MWPPISSRRADRRYLLWLAPLAPGLSGCAGEQAVLDSASVGNDATGILAWIMFAGGALIFAVVLFTAGIALAGSARAKRLIADRRLILIGGIAFPIAALTALLLAGLIMQRPSLAGNLAIRIVGEQWWWRVTYERPDGTEVVTANEVRLPRGQPVRFVLESADVIHSFWIPAIGGKLDMIPGRTNSMVVQADRPGTYRGQCAEFCGDQHALMAVTVTVLEPDDFAVWLDAEQAPATAELSPEAEAGAAVFTANGCGACHTIRGTSATGTIGPDLTHIGSRPTIAAGTLPNNVGTLAAWIVNAQAIKPGALMPSFTSIAGPDLPALAAYLSELK